MLMILNYQNSRPMSFYIFIKPHNLNNKYISSLKECAYPDFWIKHASFIMIFS